MTAPPREVYLPKYRAEAEKQRKADSAAFMKTVPLSKWVKR